MTHDKDLAEAAEKPGGASKRERQPEVWFVERGWVCVYDKAFCTATPVIATTAPLCWIADLWLPGNIKHTVETLTVTLRENT